MPDSVKRNVEHWAKLNPDFQIIEWNESNIDVSKYEFGRRAYNAKKWGFLVDTIRPLKLVEEGGFYVDADIEMIRPLNVLDTERNHNKLLMGYMYDCALGTAILYSPKNHPYLKSILNAYNYIKPDFWPVSNSIFTDFFVNKVPNFLLNGQNWENDFCRLYPKEFFEQPSFFRQKGISIHHCCGSWQKAFAGDFKVNKKLHIFSHLIKWFSRQYRAMNQLKNNEFSDCYRAAIKNIHLGFDHSKFYTVKDPFNLTCNDY